MGFTEIPDEGHLEKVDQYVYYERKWSSPASSKSPPELQRSRVVT